MSVPANLMKQMIAQQGKAGPPNGGAATSMGPTSDDARTMPPAAAPFSTPQEKRGLKATALAHVQIATTLLEQSLADLGHETEEGQTVYKAIQSLSKLTGQRGNDNSDLVPAEVMAMVKQLPQMGGGTPVQQELARQQAEQRMAGMRGQGAQPGGASAPIPGVMQ